MNEAMRDLTKEARRFFRDELRNARARSLSDAEAFHHVVTAMERLCAYMNGGGAGFSRCREPFRKLLGAFPVTEVQRILSTPFDVLFELVRENRNAAVHEGAHARHLARQCSELGLLLEEALMAAAEQISDFMVREPVCLELWQPVSIARQQMLLHSFSFLPVKCDDGWYLVSDHAVAKYLACNGGHAALARTIEEAAARGLVLDKAVELGPSCSKVEALERTSPSKPVLVTEDGRLLGIATAFDLL